MEDEHPCPPNANCPNALRPCQQSVRRGRADPDQIRGVRQRTRLGLSQKESAERLGVDPGTLARWERGEREPQGGFLKLVERLFEDGEISGARRAG